MKNKNEYRRCPACHKSDTTQIGEKNNFLMLSCRNCYSLYSSYLPIDEQAEDYDVYYTENNLKVPEFILGRLNKIVEGFQPYFTHGRFLDIGFGAAALLQTAEKKGWKVTGAEVSKSAIEHARKLGFEVFHGELNDAKYPDNYFDVITASEIIEHCPQPEILLDEVIRILRPGGLFWATTPSAKGLSYQLTGLEWSVIYPPEHLQLFSKKGIGLMLKKSGFSSFKIQTSGFSPMEVADTYRKRWRGNSSQGKSFSRVEADYALNESLTKSPGRQKIKNVLNGTLNFLSIGDSLKIKAVK